MIWTIEWDARAFRELSKLDRAAQRRIRRYLRERIATDEDPRRFGESLAGVLAGLWRYRVGDYRIICRIESSRLVVVVVRIGHRKEVYR
ncbi:MAG: type II toxin-antitoxin system RelE/ParE family toxin [bacterium]|nr:type II toxin-antitoxin system RelE/ParE family toxin [bacterium]